MIKKTLKKIFVREYWDSRWGGAIWKVIAIYEKRLWFIHWEETEELSDFYTTKKEAKAVAKRLYQKYKLK